MPEVPDIRPGWPESVPADRGALRSVRPIGGHPPRFGVAHELDVIQRESADAGYGFGAMSGLAPAQSGSGRRPLPPPTREPGPWDRLRTWWACRETQPIDVWHRMLCRFGRHDIQGGRQIQIGGGFLNTERCCVRCGAKPEL